MKVSRKRRQHEAQFKLRVALEAAKGLKTISQIASEYNLHPNLVSSWKKQLMEEGTSIFSSDSARRQHNQEMREAELYEQIGRLKMELEWLKKKLPAASKVKRTMIELNHSLLSLRRQCALLGLSRATVYHQPARETLLNLLVMRLIDEEYTRTPFYGYRKLAVRLQQRG
jgi:putative transposase